MKHWETVGGQVTQGINFAKMLDLLRELQEVMAVQGHLVKMQGSGDRDNALAAGWLVCAENIRMIERFVIQMAQGKIIQ